MAGNNLSVKITADVADLQVKFAIARAEANGLSAEFNKLARSAAAGAIDPATSTRLQQLSGDLLHARGEAAGYSEALSRAGVAVGGFSGRMEEAHGSISTTARELHRLFEEMSSGAGASADVTLLKLGQHLLGLSPAALIGVGAAGALAAALGYLGYQAIETSKALDSMRIGAEFAGNFDLTRDRLKQFTDELSQASNISHSQALSIASTFARMHDMSAPQMQALTQLVSDYAAATAQKADKAAESLARIFEPKETAAEFARSLGGTTQAQINIAQAADRSGNAEEVFASKLDLVNTALGRARGAMDENNASIFSSIKNYLGYSGALASGTSIEEVRSNLLEHENIARQKQVSLLQQAAAQIRSTPQPQQTLQLGVETAEKENPVALQVEEAKSKITEMTTALGIARQTADQVSIDKLTAGLAKANEDLSALQMGPVLDRMRTQMEQVASTWDGTQSGMLEKQRQVAQQALAETTKNSKEYLSVQQELARLDVQIRQTSGQEIIASARNQVEAINSQTSIGAAQRLERERDVWQQLLGGEQLTASQRVDVQRSLNQSIAALNKEQQAETTAITRSDADTEVAISRMKLDASKAAMEAEVTTTQAAADRKLAILRSVADQEYALDRQQLQGELDSLQSQPVEYNRVYNQIRELDARHQVDLTNLDRQGAAERAKLAEQQVTEWQKAVGEVSGAESGLVSDLINKRKTLAQSLLQIGSSMLTQEIANDLRAMTTRIALGNTEAAAKKALEQGGYLYHLIFDNQKTATTIAGSAARTAAVTAAQTQQTAATAAAAASQAAVAATTGEQIVMSDAAKAYAGTFASVAQIPYVGWAMAPGLAAGAFAEVSAMAGLASLDVGAWNVPHDMVAQIHAGETVMPTTFAEGFRRSAQGEQKGGGGDVHHHHNWNISAVDAHSFDRMLSQQTHRSALVRHLESAFRDSGKYTHLDRNRR